MGQVNFSGRLFSFGCSFTSYHWPTWADILGREFSYYENWGQSGGSNQFIFYSLIECISKNQICANDTVIVMWSTTEREEFYRAGAWILPGPMREKSIEERKQYTDSRGFLIKDCCAIDAARRILKSLGVNYYFLSMSPIGYGIPNTVKDDIFKTFEDSLMDIRPSVLEVIFKFNWNSRPFLDDKYQLNKDSHQTATEKFYNQIRGIDWPSYQDFINKNFCNVPSNIIEEIEFSWRESFNKFSKFEKKAAKNDSFFKGANPVAAFSSPWWTKRFDLHPTTQEHMEYINFVLPEIPLSTATVEFVERYRDSEEERKKWSLTLSKKVKRF